MAKKRFVLIVLVMLLALMMSSCSEDVVQSGGIDEENILRVATTLPDEVYTPLVREFFERTGIWAQVTVINEAELEAAFASSDYDFFLGGGSDYYENHTTEFSRNPPPLDDIYDEFKSNDGTWFGVVVDPIVFVSNRTLISVSDAPSTWDELLALEFSAIAIADIESDDMSLTAVAEMVQHFDASATNKNLRAIYDTNSHSYLKSMSDVVEAVYTGRFPIGVVTEREAWAYIDENAGSANAVFISYPQDGNIAVTEGAAISKRASHYGAAYKFASFVAGEDAQNYLSEALNLRPALTTAVTPPKRAKLEALNITPYASGWIYERKQSILAYWETLKEAGR